MRRQGDRCTPLKSAEPNKIDATNTNSCSEVIAVATSIRLNPKIERRLDALATRTRRTKAFYVRELIERGLEDMEDYYLAAEVLERVRRGDEPVYALEAVERELGLAD